MLQNEIFLNFSPTQSCTLVPTPANYNYIPVSNPVHNITGTVTGVFGELLEGAIVMAKPGFDGVVLRNYG